MFIDVLILVLMEDTLGEHLCLLLVTHLSLNPCSNGRYSRRPTQSIHLKNYVLILVLMKDTLGAGKTYESFISEVLIILRPTNSAFVNTN